MTVEACSKLVLVTVRTLASRVTNDVTVSLAVVVTVTGEAVLLPVTVTVEGSTMLLADIVTVETSRSIEQLPVTVTVEAF